MFNEWQIFIFNGDDKTASAQRIFAVDVEHFLSSSWQSFQQSLDVVDVTTLHIQQEDL